MGRSSKSCKGWFWPYLRICVLTGPGFDGRGRQGRHCLGGPSHHHDHRQHQQQHPDALPTEELQPTGTPSARRQHIHLLICSSLLLHQVSTPWTSVSKAGEIRLSAVKQSFLAFAGACKEEICTDSPFECLSKVHGVDYHVGHLYRGDVVLATVEL